MDDTDAQIAVAPLPTSKTLNRRQNLAVQAARFLALNVRILRMVARGHH